MTRPLLLDLFCGAGGAAMGYALAGFEVWGLDHKPQPRFPWPERFIEGDALAALAALAEGRELEGPGGELLSLEHLAVLHASPPCQAYSRLRHLGGSQQSYPDLVAAVRQGLQATGKPYVIENVEGAPLDSCVMLCGTMFGLGVYRHRFFECSHLVWQPEHPRHRVKVGEGMYTVADGGGRFGVGRCGRAKVAKGQMADWTRAMGIDWMGRRQLTQAIPPAYTKYLGRALRDLVTEES